MKKVNMTFLIIIILTVSYSCQIKKVEKKSAMYDNITVEELKKQMDSDSDFILLDVRTPAEYIGPLGNIEGSILIPLHELQARIGELTPSIDKEILVICRSGNRSRTASNILVQNGFKAASVSGGMNEWNKMKKLMDIESE